MNKTGLPLGWLTGCQTYLCGPMTACNDNGEGWRAALTPRLQELGVVVIDPCNKPTVLGCEDIQAREHMNMLKEQGRFDEFRAKFKQIRRVDLRAVDKSDFIIFGYGNEHTVGTWEELTVAVQQQKPVLVLLRNGLGVNDINPWILAMVELEFIFTSEDDLMSYLENIHRAESHPENKKWCIYNLMDQYSSVVGRMIKGESSVNIYCEPSEEECDV